MLPAAFQRAGDFISEGFLDTLKSRKLSVDLLLVDPQMSSLTDRSFLAKLRSECILPARAAGCTSLWLAGISMGAFIALLYAEAFPADITGLCLLAPYLGNHIVISEIAGHPSLASWEIATASISDEFNEERRLWRFAARSKTQSVQW